MKTKILIIFLLSLFLAACAHTNKLENYNLKAKKVLFDDRVSANARQLEITTKSSYNKKDDEKEKEKDNEFLEQLAGILAGGFSESTKDDIVDAVDTESLIAHISEGMKNTLTKYLNVEIVNSMYEEPDYIVENSLERCKLNVSKSSTTIYVSAESRILDLKSGDVVWDNTESKSIPLSGIISVGNKKFDSQIEADLFLLGQLASLPKEEVNNKIGLAAEEVGRDMGETLREDIAEANMKKKSK